jgi:branched-chain amino acid transport system substrate-binding protein
MALDGARKLVEKEHVSILAGVIGSGSAYALSKFVEKHKIPFVISNAGADDLTQRSTNPYIVRPCKANSSSSHPLGEWLYEKGHRKAVLMGADYAAGYEHGGGIAWSFKKKGGKIIQEIWPPLGTKDYAPYLAKINRDADVVMVFFAGADALRFVKQYADYGLKGKILLVGKGLVDDKILQKQGKAAEGIVSASHWFLLLDKPENKKFVDAYKKKFGHPPTEYSEQGYLTAKLIADALNKTKGKVEGKKFVQVMRSIELKAPRGLVKFDEFGSPIQNTYIAEVKKVDDSWQSVTFKTYPKVSQFWTLSAEEYMKQPTYSDMKGKWTE